MMKNSAEVLRKKGLRIAQVAKCHNIRGIDMKFAVVPKKKGDNRIVLADVVVFADTIDEVLEKVGV